MLDGRLLGGEGRACLVEVRLFLLHHRLRLPLLHRAGRGLEPELGLCHRLIVLAVGGDRGEGWRAFGFATWVDTKPKPGDNRGSRYLQRGAKGE